MAKSTASTASHSATGVGSQNSTPHSFQMPNGVCAAQCILDITNYGACYSSCVNNQPSIVSTGGGSVNPITPVNVSGSKPVVDPSTGKPTTSGTAVQGNSPANQTYPSSGGIQNAGLTNINWQDVGIRAGLVIGGSILIIVGLIKLFGAEKIVAQVNQPMSNPTLPRRPSEPPKPIVTRRTIVETKPSGGTQVDNTPSSPAPASANTTQSAPRKYTPRQVGAIKAKQRTHLAQK